MSVFPNLISVLLVVVNLKIDKMVIYKKIDLNFYNDHFDNCKIIKTKN